MDARITAEDGASGGEPCVNVEETSRPRETNRRIANLTSTDARLTIKCATVQELSLSCCQAYGWPCSAGLLGSLRPHERGLLKTIISGTILPYVSHQTLHAPVQITVADLTLRCCIGTNGIPLATGASAGFRVDVGRFRTAFGKQNKGKNLQGHNSIYPFLNQATAAKRFLAKK